jgi:type III secretion protein J
MRGKFILGLLLLYLTLATTGCNRSHELVSGLTETEAQRICVLLNLNGLDASKIKVGSEDQVTWSVVMPAPYIIGEDKISSALYVLNENDLPRSKRDPYKEAFKSDSLIPTQTEESLRKLAATQESIELTLEKISGIVSAQVHVVLPNPNPLVETSKQVQASASVLLKYNTDTPPLSLDEVRSLVAPSVEGLSPDRVQVVVKAVPKPDIARFADLKNRYIKIIFVIGLSLIVILSIALISCIYRLRNLNQQLGKLERNNARLSKKDQPQTAAAS